MPAGIKDSFDIFSRHDKLPKFKKKCILNIGSPMLFNDYCGMEHQVDILQEITDKVMGEVGRLIE